jgi:hypothetical protein
MPKQLVVVRCLQPETRGRGTCHGSIIFSQNRARIEGIGELNSVQVICGRRAVAKAKQSRVVAWLSAGRIAVLRFLFEQPDMRRTFDRPRRRYVDLPQEVEVANLIGVGLRRGVGRAPRGS